MHWKSEYWANWYSLFKIIILVMLHIFVVLNFIKVFLGYQHLMKRSLFAKKNSFFRHNKRNLFFLLPSMWMGKAWSGVEMKCQYHHDPLYFFSLFLFFYFLFFVCFFNLLQASGLPCLMWSKNFFVFKKKFVWFVDFGIISICQVLRL